MLTPRDFQKQRNRMLDFCYETERQFIELVRIIPRDNDENTHSPILYNILQSACGQIENLLRLICDRYQIKYERKKFPVYHELINKNKILDNSGYPY